LSDRGAQSFDVGAEPRRQSPSFEDPDGEWTIATSWRVDRHIDYLARLAGNSLDRGRHGFLS
jgi:hypothetical protein